MSAHTKGPWEAGGETGFHNQVAINPSIGCAYGAGEEVKANARVMAAGPDLLAALEKARRAMIVSVTGISDGLTIWQIREWIAEADAALAKATHATPQ